MIETILKNKTQLKYKTYLVRGEEIKVTGIGKKSIKYSSDKSEEDKFAFYDSFEGKLITQELIKSFDNEFWNEEVRDCISAQERYTKQNHDPRFAPEDGFCWSCGKQIYGGRGYDLHRASNELITGCPHCHRSYLD